MSRPPQRFRAVVAVVLGAACATALVACGTSSDSSASATQDRALHDCRARWHDVGDSVLGMDRDPHPSALADRWNSVIATVAYYQSTDTAKDCQARVASQLEAVTALRQFSDKLRPYDMTYQLDQVRPAIDLYLNDPLPTPPPDERGRKVRPPAKAAVTAAMKTLTDNAAAANAELQPGWQQTSSVDLTDAAAVTSTMHDLDFLAQDSPHWRACEDALQVLVAAIRAQEGLAGPARPSPAPTDATTP
jgi:hypothetical protein